MEDILCAGKLIALIKSLKNYKKHCPGPQLVPGPGKFIGSLKD